MSNRHDAGPTSESWDYDRALRGVADINNSVSVAPLSTEFDLLPDTVFNGTQNFDEENVWYERNGGDVSGRVVNGVDRLIDLSTDGAQTDSYASVESAQIGIYRAGTKVFAAVGAWLDDYPTGDAYVDVEYGREPRTLTTEDGADITVGTEFYRLRTVENAANDPPVDLQFRVGTDFDDDGTGEENVITVTGQTPGGFVDFDTDPKARFYVIDPLDGSGPSGITYDPKRGYIFGVLIGWYGPSSVIPYITGVGNMYGTHVERVWPIGIYDPIERPSLLRPNQPLKATVDNGTSGQSLSARVGGRQVSVYGDILSNANPTQHYVIDQTHDGGTGTEGDETGSNWQVGAVIKRKANRPGTALGILKETVASDSGLMIQARLIPESKITGTINYTRPSDVEDVSSALLVDCADDTPTRLSIGTETKAGGETVLVGKKFDGNLLGSGKNEVFLGETEGDFQFPLVRENPTVILFSVRDRTASPDVDWSFKVAEEG